MKRQVMAAKGDPQTTEPQGAPEPQASALLQAAEPLFHHAGSRKRSSTSPVVSHAVSKTTQASHRGNSAGREGSAPPQLQTRSSYLLAERSQTVVAATTCKARCSTVKISPLARWLTQA